MMARRRFLMVPLAAAMLVTQVASAAPGDITTIAGGGIGDGAPGVGAVLQTPMGVAIDADGDLYIADTGHHRIRKVDTSGIITTVAGTGVPGYDGDGGHATSATLNSPGGVALDGAGNLFVADISNHAIRKVEPSGIITTVAGDGAEGFSGDGGPAITARLNRPHGVAVGAGGDVLIADTGNNRIRGIDVSGTITTVAGDGSSWYGGDFGQATSAGLAQPRGVAVDRRGRVFIADTDNHSVRMVDARGKIKPVVGDGTRGYSSTGPSLTARLHFPGSVAIDSAGNIFIADTHNDRIRRVTSRLLVHTTVGPPGGAMGEAGALAIAYLTQPSSVAVDVAGNQFIADTFNNRIIKVDGSGLVSTVAGGGIGDGGPATNAAMNNPRGIAVDTDGNVFVADWLHSRIRKIDNAGVISTVAGTDHPGYAGDGASATTASLLGPTDVATDPAGNLFIADAGNHRIRRVDTSGTITTLAGSGSPGYSGDGGPAAAAELNNPQGVAVDAAGNLFIADTDNHRIRKVAADGTITTIAGVADEGYSGDGGPAAGARLDHPRGLAAGNDGSIFIADTDNHRIRKVGIDGKIVTIMGNGMPFFGGIAHPSTQSRVAYPHSVDVDSVGNVFVADTEHHTIRMLSVSGSISCPVGTGDPGYSGDGGPGTEATLFLPKGIAVDADGGIFVADSENHVIRYVSS